MRYDAVLLDFYGTLVEEDGPIIHRIVQVIAEDSPLKPSLDRVAQAWRFADYCADAHDETFRSQRALEIESLRDLLTSFSCGLDAAVLSQELFAYWCAPRAFPEADSFLRSVSAPICIVSNIDREDICAAIAHSGWRFDHIVTSECCRSYKPRPEIFHEALRLLGVRAGRTLHIGDSWGSDVVGASQCGLDTAWVNRRARRRPDGASHLPTLMAVNLTELAELLSHQPAF